MFVGEFTISVNVGRTNIKMEQSDSRLDNTSNFSEVLWILTLPEAFSSSTLCHPSIITKSALRFKADSYEFVTKVFTFSRHYNVHILVLAKTAF